MACVSNSGIGLVKLSPYGLVRLSVDKVREILTDNRCTNESATGFTPCGGTLILLFQGGHFGHRQSHRLDNSLQCQKANAWIAIPNP